MSTIATKYSTASTQFKVGTAAVALVAAATITPAAAYAAPDFASVPQAVGNSVLLNYVGDGSSAAAAASPILEPIGAVVDFAFQAVGGIIWVTLEVLEAGASFIGADVLATSLGEASDAVAFFFRVGPYSS